MLDDLDLDLISELQRDSRQTNIQLARKFGVTETTIRRRLDKIVTSGAIRFTIIANPKMFGYDLAVLMLFNTNIGMAKTVAQRLAEKPNIYDIALITGQYDIVACGYFRSTEELFDFLTGELTDIEGIDTVQSCTVLWWSKRAYESIKLPPKGTPTPL